jgi:cysteinyl-tRNA synthetase
VEIFDRLGKWQRRDGVSGSLKGFSAKYDDKITACSPIDCTLSQNVVQDMVEERTMLRRRRMFLEADKVRDELAAAGVELMDLSNEWRSYDGKLSGMQSFDR